MQVQSGMSVTLFVIN